jgi:hypothetical protein
MFRWFKQRPLRTALIVWLLLLVPLTVDFNEFTYHMIRTTGLAVAVGIVIAFANSFWTWWKSPVDLPLGHGLAAGIWLLWLGMLGHVVNNMLAQFYVSPPAFVHNIVGTISLWVGLAGGFLMLLSSEGINHGTLVNARGLKWGVRIAVIVFIALVFTWGVRADDWWGSRPIIDWIVKVCR